MTTGEEITVIQLPPLRLDLKIHPGPPDNDGAPTWTIYDPVSNKFFKIGWFEFECLTRFRNHQFSTDLIATIKRETPLDPTEEDIKELVMFLVGNQLVRATDIIISDYLEDQKEKTKTSLLKKAVQGYLFVTIPLFKPQKFLDKTYRYLKFLTDRRFIWSCFVLLMYGIFLTFQRLDEFTTTFTNYLNFEGVMLAFITAACVKVFHELGHAYTATKYGVKVPVIGIALIVLYPVLYTETSNAWKLVDRKQRLHIAAGGILTEMCIASFALILWHSLPPGPMQSVAFFIAFVSLFASILINFNPLMRFDGYYLMCDYMGIDNLQDRACAFAKWRLRKLLFGWDDHPPEHLHADRHRFLQIFGFSLIVYRFFLFLGISLIVYHLFFKPLGLILMMVELIWFIGFPILREINVWISERERIWQAAHGRIILSFIIVLILLSFFPLRGNVDVPAVQHVKNYNHLYPPVPARIEGIHIENGAWVEKDAIIYTLTSPALDNEISVARQMLELYTTIRDREQATPGVARQRLTIEEEIKAAENKLNGLLAQKSRLTMTAPFSGYIQDVPPDLHVGRWVNPQNLLGILMDREEILFSGYIREKDIQRIQTGARGLFYSNFGLKKPVNVILSSVTANDTRDLYWDELASINGGPLPADRGFNELSPPKSRYPVFFVTFQLDGTISDFKSNFAEAGIVILKAEKISLAGGLVERVISLFVRESGL